MTVFKAGDEVLVARKGWATFEVQKIQKKGSKYIEEAPRPWYPHGKVVIIDEINGDYCKVSDKDGKKWAYPIGTWCLIKDLDFYTRGHKDANDK